MATGITRDANAARTFLFLISPSQAHFSPYLPPTREHISSLSCFLVFKIDLFYLFLERGREWERERNIHVWLSLECPLLGTWPTAQACALIGNWTCDPLVCTLALNPLSYTSQGLFKKKPITNIVSFMTAEILSLFISITPLSIPVSEIVGIQLIVFN